MGTIDYSSGLESPELLTGIAETQAFQIYSFYSRYLALSSTILGLTLPIIRLSGIPISLIWTISYKICKTKDTLVIQPSITRMIRRIRMSQMFEALHSPGLLLLGPVMTVPW